MELEIISEKTDAMNPIDPLRINYFCLEIVNDEKYDTKEITKYRRGEQTFP